MKKKAYVYDMYISLLGPEGVQERYLTSLALDAGYVDDGTFEDVCILDNTEYETDPTGNITLIPESDGSEIVLKFKLKGSN